MMEVKEEAVEVKVEEEYEEGEINLEDEGKSSRKGDNLVTFLICFFSSPHMKPLIRTT